MEGDLFPSILLQALWQYLFHPHMSTCSSVMTSHVLLRWYHAVSQKVYFPLALVVLNINIKYCLTESQWSGRGTYVSILSPRVT
jgi:hypothetical protein